MLIKYKNFLHKLLRRVATKKRYSQLPESVSKPEKGYGRAEWILSRPLYHYARFTFKSITRPQREQALGLQIRQWSPYARTGSYVLWNQDTAQVWAWDAERVETAILVHKLNPKNTNVVPETLLHDRQKQGAYLSACLEGIEGQAWLNDTMTNSRWWPKLPTAHEWINFQRDAGLSPENQSSELPPVLQPILREKPWARSAASGGSSIHAGQAEQWIVPAVLLCLLVATVWYVAQWVKLQGAIKAQGSELDVLTQQSGPIIEARGKALDALNRIRALQSLDPYPDQISLMGKVAESLPADGAYLKEWEFQNGKLKLQIASPNKLMGSVYIKLFESFDLFRKVQAATSNDPTVLILNMEVIPQAERKLVAGTNETAKMEAAVAQPR